MDRSRSQTNGGLGSGADHGGRGGRADVPSVLVAERSRATRRLMRRALQPAYEAKMAARYEECRRCAQEQAFDAVVVGLYPLDLDDGLELVTDLRAKARYEEGPIIAVCHPSVEAQAESLRATGFDDTLRMPFGQSALRSVLDRHLGGA